MSVVVLRCRNIREMGFFFLFVCTLNVTTEDYYKCYWMCSKSILLW